MYPKTLSASAGASYEACPAMFHAQYIERARTPSGDPADMGSLCHEVLEWWVKEDLLYQPLSVMLDHYAKCYPKYFDTDEPYADGEAMLTTWHGRQDWTGRTVHSVEIKETFDLPLGIKDPVSGEDVVIPFTYIWDRADVMDDGGIEIVDYKSWRMPVQPGDLKGKLQPRAYALAAQIKWPQAPYVWVTMDQLRYDTVSLRFTREDSVKTWAYLRNLGRRIYFDDGTKENVNSMCRWCVRNTKCEAFQAHARVGGIMGITDLDEAISLRAKSAAIRNAMNDRLTELDDFILAQMERENITTRETPEYALSIGLGGRRVIDSERAAQVLGPEIMAEYAKIGVTQVDALLKGDEIDDDQKRKLKGLIRKSQGKPQLKIKEKTSLDAVP